MSRLSALRVTARSSIISSLRLPLQTISRTLTATAASSPSSPAEETKFTNRTRIGIGGTKLASPQQSEHYACVIQTALVNNVTTFEASAIGEGERALYNAFQIAQKRVTSDNHKGVDVPATATMLARFGYRTVNADSPPDEAPPAFPNDVSVASQQGEGGAHSMSQEYVHYCLANSPLVELKQKRVCNSDINLIYMAHNPETQGGALYESISSMSIPPPEEIRAVIRERLQQSFIALEEACSNNTISSYGVCSNGLSLPEKHPLHLNWKDVIEAACDAATAVHGEPTAPRLSALQLPANLLETNGIQVAQKIQQFLRSISPKQEDSSTPSQILPRNVEILISRPLTCYPDQGVGTGYPFKLVNYQINTNLDPEGPPRLEWTHHIQGAPPQYPPALNAAMGHFDAEAILEEQKVRPLTVEERETLQGCRLLQSMLHDLDASFPTMRSFQAYEED